ncbi:MAG: elongation factor P [Candidatus Firestonebacteria bacterium]
MISTNDFRKGVIIEVDNISCEVIDFQHVKPGKGGAFVRTKLKNVKTGAVLDKTFNAGIKVKLADLEEKSVQYLYKSEKEYHFMDDRTYEQIYLTQEQIGDNIKFLKENMTLDLVCKDGVALTIKFPTFVELKITDTPPGVKGDTAATNSKPATVETGALIQVPFFINIGDVIKIDTRTNDYVERVK